MKKWLRRLGIVFAALIVLGAVLWVYGESENRVVVKKYESNEKLRTIKPDWPGTPVDEQGRFVNYEHPYLPRMNDLLRWQLSSNPFKEAKKNDTERLEVRDPAAFLAGDRDGILWLGHASFYIRLDGVSYLIDPIFGQPPLVKRFVEVPSPLADIRRVDYVLLSHDHRDHTDETTLRAVAEKFPSAVFIGGLKMDDIFNEWKTPTNAIETAGWFQQYDMPAGVPELFFVPVRHWARRGLFDTNQRLWGGYVLKGKTASVYFGGDSGYGRHYRDVGELFPNIDYFLIGIGAFEPRWFMHPVHNSPEDALKAFVDIGAKTLVPMHYGTFDLSDEPPGEPLRQLRQKAAEMGLTERLKVLTINESLDLP
jgi:L-ascorbate metabolism protein UlaG (beta-lactamase superfamily)